MHQSSFPFSQCIHKQYKPIHSTSHKQLPEDFHCSIQVQCIWLYSQHLFDRGISLTFHANVYKKKDSSNPFHGKQHFQSVNGMFHFLVMGACHLLHSKHCDCIEKNGNTHLNGHLQLLKLSYMFFSLFSSFLLNLQYLYPIVVHLLKQK